MSGRNQSRIIQEICLTKGSISSNTRYNTLNTTMGSSESKPRSDQEHKSHRSGRHGRREDSDIPGSSRQPNCDDNAVFGGICESCQIEYDDLNRHYRKHHSRSTPADLSASMHMDREEPERPQYGKDMHPSHRNFSAQNTMTSSSFDSRQIPLERAEDERRIPPSASDSVRSSRASQAPESPPLAELNARTWNQTRRTQSQRDYLRPDAPFSQASGFSSGIPVPQYSERIFRRLDSRDTSHPVEDRSEGLSARQAAQNQPIRDPREHPPSPSSYGNASTAGSVSYAYLSPGSLSPRSRESMSPPSPVPPGPQDRRGRERNRPRYEPSARSSSTQSEYRSHRDRESRESDHASQYPPRTSERRQRRQGHRDGRSRSRASHHAEARPPRSSGYDNSIASEEYAAREGYAGAPRTPYPPSERQYYQTGGVVFPGDRSQFSQSYLQEMGRIRFDNPGRYDTREDEGRYVEDEVRYVEDEYDSDDHQFTTDYLREMARIRHGGSGHRF